MSNFDLSEIEIYPMKIADVEQVYSIEVETFPSPWSKINFISQLLRSKFNFYLVAKKGNEVIGYIGMIQGMKEGHITTIAVKSKFKRKKIGTILLISLIKKAIKKGITRLHLEVRESNKSAQKFYEKFKFATIGKRIAYYSDTNDNALVMNINNIIDSEYKDFILKMENEILKKYF